MSEKELTKERMAELLRAGATAKDFDMKDGKLLEKAEPPSFTCAEMGAHYDECPHQDTST